MRILFTGGGTLGPVTPLLAVYEALKKLDPHLEALWVGTPDGPEREVVNRMGIAFVDLPVARLPRYPTWEWARLPIDLVRALVGAWTIVHRHRPDVVASAGGFTALPVIVAAKMFNAKVWVHQQDVKVTLTTRLTAPFADRLTCAWEVTAQRLGTKAAAIGNPVRLSVLRGAQDRGRSTFGIGNDLPTVLVFGGGTGARWMNEMIAHVVAMLCTQANVIHITGKGKPQSGVGLPNYRVYEFLDADMADAFALADVVVCRAGMGTITELAALGKPSIVIPLPRSAQEANARAIEDACVVLDQTQTTADDLLKQIAGLLDDPARRRSMGERISTELRTDIADELAAMLQGLEKK